MLNFMGLRPKQILFVKEYLLDGNATRAAKAAGYSKKTANKIGSENLAKPDIRKAIDENTKKQVEKLDFDGQKVLRRIAEIAFKKSNSNKDVLRACELLGKNLKLFTDVVENSGPNGGPQVIFHTYENGSEAANNGDD